MVIPCPGVEPILTPSPVIIFVYTLGVLIYVAAVRVLTITSGFTPGVGGGNATPLIVETPEILMVFENDVEPMFSVNSALCAGPDGKSLRLFP
jgi:hypothetical protein